MAGDALEDLVAPHGSRVGLLVQQEGDSLGPGRLRAIADGSATVEYFDHPGAGGTIVRSVPIERLGRARLAPQTRVHFLERGEWQHGRVAEHDLDAGTVEVRMRRGRAVSLAETEVVVRWRRRLADASELLADRWVESRRFHDARAGFVDAYLARVGAYQGLTAVCSAAVEVHDHQLEAMRRVLTDISPRYLLADEVGLGKTIEAGLLVRQHLLDGNDGTVLVLVPQTLVGQWQAELDRRFRIERQFPGRCRVAAFEQLDAGPAGNVSFLVVDEAHRMAAARAEATIRRRYERLRELAGHAEGLLLLSATPLLQDAESLLRLLHLLAPDAHPLDDLAGFEAALAARDEIATYVGNLGDDADPVFLRAALDGLRTLLPQDRRLAELLDAATTALDGDPEALRAAIRRVRSHVTEVHRIHGRMIRSRRAAGLAEEFPVLGREEPARVAVADALRDVRTPFALWHEHVLARIERTPEDARASLVAAVASVVEARSLAGGALSEAASARQLAEGATAPDAEESELLETLEAAARSRARDCPRTLRAVALALAGLRAGERVAVAASSDAVAAEIERRLCDVAGGAAVWRISDGDPAAADAFGEARGGAVLVLGPAGEEGHNLQAAETVVHVDLPWDPNRLEQRIGRFDRFGAGLAARQLVLADDDASVANAWCDVLEHGFGLFAGSIASLQALAVARLLPELVEVATIEGADALRSRSAWVAEELEHELAAVELAELLDETVLDERGRGLLASVERAEAGAEVAAWRDAVVRWAAGDGSDAADLRFAHEQDGMQHRFALTRFENPAAAGVRAADLPLVPWSELSERFAGAMEAGGAAVGTFRRGTAVQRHMRLFEPGDPFVDALWQFAELDDRGRSFAVWRAREYWREREELLALCFDFRVRPDVEPALEGLAGTARRVAEASLRRRAESYLAPIGERVWFDARGGELRDERLLRVLDHPYAELRGDRTLRPEEWDRIEDHVGPEGWAPLCGRLSDRGREAVARRRRLVERCAHAAAALLEDSDDAAARLGARRDPTSHEAAEAERRVGRALAAGIATPAVEVDAAGVVVLSGDPLPQESP